MDCVFSLQQFLRLLSYHLTTNLRVALWIHDRYLTRGCKHYSSFVVRLLFDCYSFLNRRTIEYLSSVYRVKLLSSTWESAARCEASPFQRYANLDSSHHEFTRCLTNRDEIHPLGQAGDINLLAVGGDAARQQGLSHEVADAVFWAAATM